MASHEPNQARWDVEHERLERIFAQDQFRVELIDSLDEELEQRDQIVAILNDALKFDPNLTVQNVFDDAGKSLGLQTNLSNRGFFTDPANVEKYGKPNLQRSARIILDFTSQKLDQNAKNHLSVK